MNVQQPPMNPTAPMTGAQMMPQPQGGMPAGAQPPMGGNPMQAFAQLLPIIQQHIATPGGQQQMAQALAAKLPAPPAHIIQQLQTGQIGHMMNGPNQAPAGLPAAAPTSPVAAASPAGAPISANPFEGLR